MARITLILSQPSRGDALRALTKQGKHPGADFVGPTFEDGKLAIKDGFAHITVDKVTYSYPAHAINRVRFEA